MSDSRGPVVSRSFPYLSIARFFDVDYGDVLLFAQWVMQGRPVERDPHTRDALRRLTSAINHLVVRDFVVCIEQAVAEFERIRREGW